MMPQKELPQTNRDEDLLRFLRTAQDYLSSIRSSGSSGALSSTNIQDWRMFGRYLETPENAFNLAIELALRTWRPTSSETLTTKK
jgi:hypothetical protein